MSGSLVGRVLLIVCCFCCGISISELLLYSDVRNKTKTKVLAVFTIIETALLFAILISGMSMGYWG